MKRCMAVGLSVVAATISTSATVVVCAPRASPLQRHMRALLNSIVHQLWHSALQSLGAGSAAVSDRACTIMVVTCMELIAAVAPCLVAASFPSSTCSSGLLQWSALLDPSLISLLP